MLISSVGQFRTTKTNKDGIERSHYMQVDNHCIGIGHIYEQEGPPIDGAVRNAISLIPQRLSHIILDIARSENVPALPYIGLHGRGDRNNNTTPAIHAMHRSITRKSQRAFYVTRKRR